MGESFSEGSTIPGLYLESDPVGKRMGAIVDSLQKELLYHNARIESAESVKLLKRSQSRGDARFLEHKYTGIRLITNSRSGKHSIFILDGHGLPTVISVHNGIEVGKDGRLPDNTQGRTYDADVSPAKIAAETAPLLKQEMAATDKKKHR